MGRGGELTEPIAGEDEDGETQLTHRAAELSQRASLDEGLAAAEGYALDPGRRSDLGEHIGDIANLARVKAPCVAVPAPLAGEGTALDPEDEALPRAVCGAAAEGSREVQAHRSVRPLDQD